MKLRPLLLSTLLLGISSMAASQSAQAPATPPSPSSAIAGPGTHSAAATATGAAPAPSPAKTSPQSQLILANADKLVDLAQQLKTEVDKTNQYTLSLNTLRRAEEVEKMARELQKQLEHSKK